MLPEPAQRRRPVFARGRPRGISRIRADFGRVVQERHASVGTAQHVGEVRRLVAGGASGFVAEQTLAAARGLLDRSCLSEGPACASSVDSPAEPASFGVTRSGVCVMKRPMRGSLKVALAAHLPHAHVAVPVRDRPVAGERLEADALQSIDRRDDDRQRGLFSGRRFVPSNAWCRGSYLPGPHVRELRLGASSSAGDSATIAPTFRSVFAHPSSRLPIPAHEGVVDRGVAERAGDADAGELARVVDLALDADDRIQPQQFDGHGRVGQIDLAGAKRGDDRRAAAPRRRP